MKQKIRHVISILLKMTCLTVFLENKLYVPLTKLELHFQFVLTKVRERPRTNLKLRLTARFR